MTKRIKDGEHWLIGSMTRFGKSQLALRWMLEKATAGDTAVVLIDPPGTLAEEFVRHLAHRGLAGRLIWDRMTDNRNCPGYEFLTPNTGENAEELDRVACKNFKSFILQHEDKYDARQNKGIDQGLELYAAIQIQQPETPPYWFQHAFDPKSAEHKIIRSRIRDDKLLFKFVAWSNYKGTQWEMYPGALVRRLSVLAEPWVRARWGASYDFRAHLNGNGIAVFSGSLSGEIDIESLRFLCNMFTLKVLNHCRSGARTNTYFVGDEITKAGYLSAHLTAGLAELAKEPAGLSAVLLVQNPALMSADEQIQSDVMGNTFKAWGRLQADGARVASEGIGAAILDPKKVKYTRERYENVIRQEEEPYETVTRHKDSESVTKGKRTVNRHERERVTEDVPYTFDEQRQLVQQRIVGMGKGWFYFSDDEGVTPEPVYVPMLRRPFEKSPTLGDAFFRKACDLIFSGAAYRRPVTLEATWNEPVPERANDSTTSPPKKGAKGIPRSRTSRPSYRSPSGP